MHPATTQPARSSATCGADVYHPRVDTPGPGGRLAVRFVFTLAAFSLIALMNRSLQAVVREYSETFQLPPVKVAGFIVFGVLGGFTFGLAATLPGRLHQFHWRRAAVLAVVPSVVLLVNVLSVAAPGVLPGWLLDFTFLFGVEVAAAAAVLLGVASASILAAA